jgi:hypothetical protein
MRPARISEIEVEQIVQDYLEECWPSRIPRLSQVAIRLGYSRNYFSQHYPTAMEAKQVVLGYFDAYMRRLTAYAYQLCKENAACGEFSVSKAAKLLGIPRCNLTQREVWEGIYKAAKRGIIDGRAIRQTTKKDQTITIFDTSGQYRQFITQESAVAWLVAQGCNRSKAGQLISGKIPRYRHWALKPAMPRSEDSNKIHLTKAHIEAIRSDRQWVAKFNEFAKKGNTRQAEQFADFCLETFQFLKTKGAVCN